jgi:hypothetical protein|nr:MAG TPA: hypothetical protein [Caudoviricetes sp.]
MDRSVFDIANWFLTKEAMTPKKLQKLVYYYFAWGASSSKKRYDKKLSIRGMGSWSSE